MSNILEAKIIELFSTSPSAQACRELAQAIELVLRNERTALATDIYAKDVLPAYQSGKKKVETLKTAAVGAANYFSKLKAIASERGFEGLADVVKKDSVGAIESGQKAAVELYEDAKITLPLLKRAGVGFIDRIVADYESLETDDEKIMYVSKLSMYLAIFAYGAKLGNQIPDMDFNFWGAGSHRSFLSHSAAPMMTVTALSIVLTRVLERADSHLTADSDARAYSDTIKMCLGLFTVGFGVGNAFHLAKDATLDYKGTIRFHDFSGNNFGSLLPNTRIDDMSYTAVMSFFSSQMTDDSSGRAQKIGA